MFVNDPGFHAQDPKLFEGKRMTYYGRWTYKFEEAARQGAAAALIIHDTEGASYGWDVAKNSWSGAQFDLPAKDDPDPRLPVQGWITAQSARSLLADLGHNLDDLYKAANQPGFKAIPLQAKLSVDLKSTTREKSSRNVVALLPGAKRPDEAIVYMAHWDHLGNHGHEADEHGAASGGEPHADTIYNGAIDNATGVAGILEIAEAFSKQTPPPDRSLLFLAVTLEESGLLGSKYYVAHPTIPLDKTVAVINLDAMPVLGKARDMTVVGFGSSELEDLLKTAADGQQRVLHAEATPEDGFYFRSDHFNFAKAGVPALYAKGGQDLIDGGLEAGRKAESDYRDNRYHKPADQFDAAWKMDGVVQDLDALYGVGRTLAGSEQWPNWYEGNAFRSAHDKLMQSAK
jgi:Zn-dependent M28 family amino/carboxypeptidase